MNHGPLKGVRVTEFTSAWAGPYATCLLGFLGAEVIKVESRKKAGSLQESFLQYRYEIFRPE